MKTENGVSPRADTQFDDWWNKSGLWVESPNQRRGGESGVQILKQDDPAAPELYCKRQIEHLYHSFRHPSGQPTVLREQQAYESFLRLGIRVPRVHYSGARKKDGQWQGLFVTEALEDGFISLEQWLENNAAGAIEDSLHQAMLRQLGVTLARLHRARWQHGCCYPKHIFVKAQQAENGSCQVDIAFLDLEKSRRRWRIQAAAQHDLRQLWRHRGMMQQRDWHLLEEAHQHALSNAAPKNVTIPSL